jgi:hypothetical protein
MRFPLGSIPTLRAVRSHPITDTYSVLGSAVITQRHSFTSVFVLFLGFNEAYALIAKRGEAKDCLGLLILKDSHASLSGVCQIKNPAADIETTEIEDDKWATASGTHSKSQYAATDLHKFNISCIYSKPKLMPSTTSKEQRARKAATAT